MSRSFSITTQLFFVVLIFSTAAGLWVWRDRVESAFNEFSANLPAWANIQDRERRDRGKGSGLSKSSRSRAAPVIVQRVERMRNDETIAAIGTARALRSVTLFAKSDGEIVALNFKAGDRVEKGQELLKLDSVKAELAVGVAKKTVEEMQQALKRSNYLRKRRVGSGASVEDATISVERSKLQVRQAEEQLRDMTLSAPFGGVVGIAKVEVGDRVTSQTEIVTLDDRSELLVEFEIPEQFLSRINVGDSVSAATPSYAGRHFLGRVGYIDSRVDATSRTVMVRATFPNSGDLLRPGMSFAIEVKIEGDEFAVVPELSLQWRVGRSFVWVVESRKVRKVPVRLVKRRNTIVFVEGELAAGELVVVEGVQRLREGKAVVFREPAKQPFEGEPEEGEKPKSTARQKSRQKG